jgi:hypothetical protein
MPLQILGFDELRRDQESVARVRAPEQNLASLEVRVRVAQHAVDDDDGARRVLRALEGAVPVVEGDAAAGGALDDELPVRELARRQARRTRLLGNGRKREEERQGDVRQHGARSFASSSDAPLVETLGLRDRDAGPVGVSPAGVRHGAKELVTTDPSVFA